MSSFNIPRNTHAVAWLAAAGMLGGMAGACRRSQITVSDSRAPAAGTTLPVPGVCPGGNAIWDEREDDSPPGVWVERGSSDIYDANSKNLSTVNQISVRGSDVFAARLSVNSPDHNICHYAGLLSADRKTIAGTYSCQRYITSAAPWHVVIHCPPPGSKSP